MDPQFAVPSYSRRQIQPAASVRNVIPDGAGVAAYVEGIPATTWSTTASAISNAIPEGGRWVAGNVNLYSTSGGIPIIGPTSAWVARINDFGVVAPGGQQRIPSPAPNSGLGVNAVLATSTMLGGNPSGTGVILVGVQASTAVSQGIPSRTSWVWRGFPPSLIWQKTFPSTTAQMEFTDVVEAPAGGFYVVGHAQPVTSAPSSALLYHLDAAGNSVDEKTYTEGLGVLALRAITAPGGCLVVAGSELPASGGPSEGWLALFSASGGPPSFSRTIAGPPGTPVQISALSKRPNGGFAVALASLDHTWLALVHVDSLGLEVARTIVYDGGGKVGAIAALATESQTRVWLAGWRPDPLGKKQFWAAHTDAFLHPDCGTSGICEGISPEDCND